MKIVDSVSPDDVPEGETGTRNTTWRNLSNRVIADFRGGRVTRIQVADRAELFKMKQATARYWRDQKLKLEPVIVEQPDHTLDVYMQLVSTEPPPQTLGKLRGRPRRTG